MSPFDPAIREDIANPYRRAFIIATLEQKTEIQAFLEEFPQYYDSRVEVQTLHIVNEIRTVIAMLAKKTMNPLKAIFKKKNKEEGRLVMVPQKDGSLKQVRVLN